MTKGKLRLLLLTTLFSSLAGRLAALDFSPGGYASISDIYGIDDNAGLTAYPVLNVPLGGRAEGMATAFTAVSDDLTFIEWNPAGSSMLNFTELGFFHNNWIADTRVEGIVFASRYNNLGYAAAGKWLYTPFSEYNMWGDRVSKGYYSEIVGTINASYNFLSGYYFSGISVGVNLKGAFRVVPDYTNADDQGNEGELISGSGWEQSGAMAMADVGALTRFNFLKPYKGRDKNVSLGLAVRNLGPPAKGDALPTVAAAGLAYKPLRPVTLAFDFSYPMNLSDLSLSEKPYWAAGLNVEVTNFVSARAGLLGKSGGYRVTLGSAVNLANKVALDLNYTLDLLTQFTPLNRISIGVRFNFGDQGRQAASDKVDALYLDGLNAYSAGKYAEAKDYWTQALEINPRFDPAKEGIKLIEESDALMDRIMNMQSLDF
jgi:tetratricopeptide (TPR) repeat protein